MAARSTEEMDDAESARRDVGATRFLLTALAVPVVGRRVWNESVGWESQRKGRSRRKAETDLGEVTGLLGCAFGGHGGGEGDDD